MLRNILTTLGLSLCLISGSSAETAAAGSTDTLKNFHVSYTLKKGSFTIGETRRSLTTSNTGVRVFESVTKPTGLGRLFTSGEVVERSEWQYAGNAPRPAKYTYLDTSRKEPRKVELSFDWDANRVTNTINGDPWRMELTPDTQDKLLYQLHMMLDLTAGKEELSYFIADGGKLKNYAFEILSAQNVKTELGTFNAVPVRRISGKRITTLWCAEALNYLPVRIEQRKGKESPVIATISAVQGLP